MNTGAFDLDNMNTFVHRLTRSNHNLNTFDISFLLLFCWFLFVDFTVFVNLLLASYALVYLFTFFHVFSQQRKCKRID